MHLLNKLIKREGEKGYMDDRIELMHVVGLHKWQTCMMALTKEKKGDL